MTIRMSGETRLFLIVGDPIAQVQSPEHLTRILAERGANAVVAPAHVGTADLSSFVAAVQLMRNLDGLLFTVPHKFAALGYCDATSERAAFVGSVNVMRRRDDGLWQGDNLDGVGYLEGVRKEGFDVAGKRALLVGAGGAGSAIALETLARGAAAIAVHDTNLDRRDRLIAKLSARYPDRVEVGSADPDGFDLVANATPAGMREGDPLPVDAHRLSPRQFVADVITKPAVSPLVDLARRLGCATMVGVGMFNAQAELLVDTMLGVQNPRQL